MRRFVIVAVLSAACSRGAANSDSAAIRDSVVAGPAAVPATLTPPDSAESLPRPPQGGAPAPRPAGPAVPAPAAPDSILGVVSVVGTSFDKRIVVASASPTRRLTVTGPIAPIVGRVSGAEVTVRGPIAALEIEAKSFTVRS